MIHEDTKSIYISIAKSSSNLMRNNIYYIYMIQMNVYRQKFYLCTLLHHNYLETNNRS